MADAGATRDEYCVVACAEAWRGDGAVLASAFGVIPRVGSLLARATFEPALLISDGEASLTEGDAGWVPFRSVFDLVWRGKRHVMMGATQIDAHGNQNISAIGDHARPKVQMIGSRGAPGNTICHPTSYWVPRHSTRVFVPRVDFVSGVGWDRGAAEIRLVVTDLGAFDFDTPEHTMRVRSLHPGVTVDEVREATGFDLVVPGDVAETRAPTADELRLIREVLDPADRRKTEVSA